MEDTLEKRTKGRDEIKGKGTVSVLLYKCKCRNVPLKCDLLRKTQKTWESESCSPLHVSMRIGTCNHLQMTEEREGNDLEGEKHGRESRAARGQLTVPVFKSVRMLTFRPMESIGRAMNIKGLVAWETGEHSYK